MKRLLLFLIFFNPLCTSAKKYEAYIITQNKDSIPCKIILNGLSVNFVGTELVSTYSYKYIVNGKRNRFSANEVLAFGINAKGYWRTYYPMSFGKAGTRFMRIAYQDKISLYYCLQKPKEIPFIDIYLFLNKDNNGIALSIQDPKARQFVYKFIKDCDVAKSKFDEDEYNMRKHYEYVDLAKLLNVHCPNMSFETR